MMLKRAATAALISAIALIGTAGVASADPLEDFCDGPRDGKAIVQRTICPPR